jgi:Sec-independent protein translocase protein TatA
MLGSIGFPELLVIFVIALIVFRAAPAAGNRQSAWTGHFRVQAGVEGAAEPDRRRDRERQRPHPHDRHA